jgi:uncharacterized membrane protein HdeD (DUF308 family)
MNQATRPDVFSPDDLKSGLEALRARAGWIIAFGAALTALGALAFGSVMIATIVTVYFVGAAMIAAGVAEIVVGVQAKSWKSFFVWIMLGVLYATAGLCAWANPLLAAGVLTLLLGASLVASGLVRIFLAFQMKSGSAWGWVALSGAITALLGMVVLAQWPVSSLYILGVFLSVDLLFAGIGWMSLGMTLARGR